MAAAYIMPRPAEAQVLHYFQQQPPSHAYVHTQSPDQTSHQGAQHSQSRQVSPLSTSDGCSPTSTNTSHRQRLRPLYMPAVLLPTEHPYKGSFGHKSEVGSQGQCQDDGLLSSPSSFVGLSGFGAWNILRRRSTSDTETYIETDWNVDLFPVPTAPPTRHHWKPDPEATICDEPACLRNFNYWTRRHHCRRCGNIFCDLHSNFGVPLDQDANYNPRGNMSRACAHCYSEFQSWLSRTNSQVSSDDSSSISQGSQTAPVSPVTAPTVVTPPTPHPVEIAMSVPRDWHWSTF
ncbi:FYVE zinc finger protein [Xylaria nigripes]|nr:FYVE zinc finger protein [Xylaria nigripes]